MTESTSPAQDTTMRRIARRPVVAFALAALTVGGLGAAITTAAWTDNTLFAASASAATFDLEGSTDGTTWAQSDDSGAVQLVVPSSAFSDLLPGESREFALHVRNAGSVSAALTATAVVSASTFTTDPSVSISGLISTLSANGSDEFLLTVTAPADWNTSNQGKSASILVTVSGEAVAG